MTQPPIRPAVPPVPAADDAPAGPAAPAARATPSLTDHDALPAGTRFGEFEIVRVLGVGGFGIVYLAHDHSLERRVALKEYMPVSLAVRGAGQMITVRSERHAETYAMGLRSFVNEARLLARFDHPSLVKVYRFWEDNATAYMVMPYLQGTTLREARRTMAGPPGEAWIRGVLEPMLDALDQLHREGVYHRDIAPDNILIPPEGAPILLDFGAARRVISDRTQSLTAILKPSYAPIEQYAEMTKMRQGPWTDIYALGAVMHYLLFGAPPPPATARALQIEHGEPERIAQRVAPGVSPQFIGVVAWMLGVRPSDRPQNVAALRAVLAGRMQVPAVSNDPVTVPSFMSMRPAPEAVQGRTLLEPTVRLERRDEDATRFDGADPLTVRNAKPLASSAHETTTPMPHALAHPPETTAPPVAADTAANTAATTAATTAASTTTMTAASTPVDRVPGTVEATKRPSRRAVIAGIAAVSVAVLVLWQFISLIGAPRSTNAELAATGATTGSAASGAVPASAPARPPTEPSVLASGTDLPPVVSPGGKSLLRPWPRRLHRSRRRPSRPTPKRSRPRCGSASRTKRRSTMRPRAGSPALPPARSPRARRVRRCRAGRAPHAKPAATVSFCRWRSASTTNARTRGSVRARSACACSRSNAAAPNADRQAVDEPGAKPRFSGRASVLRSITDSIVAYPQAAVDRDFNGVLSALGLAGFSRN